MSQSRWIWSLNVMWQFAEWSVFQMVGENREWGWGWGEAEEGFCYKDIGVFKKNVDR